MPAALKVSPDAARRFLRRALLLDQSVASPAAALAHLGFVQIDPINVCGRMHDLILRNRVGGYREGDLHATIHSPGRPGLEHYLPRAGILVAFPADAWPFLAPLIERQRLRRKLSAPHERLARHILAEIAARGPLTSDDIEHEGRSVTWWGSPGRLVKTLLEALFVQGRVLISARRNFRRVYDLPERVLPASVRAVRPRDEQDIARWTVLLRLRQRRLATLKRAELPLVADTVQCVEVEGCPPLHCHRDDIPLLDACQSAQGGATESARHPPLLLAPLDPLIYDRRITRGLWNFDYTWEVYTPPHRRVRGYYALPVLSGGELVGYVDPKADRDSGRLRVVSRSIRRGHRVAPAVRLLAGFLDLK